MQTPPEVIFHDVDRSPWVETYIGERVQRLDRFADGITSCRVSLTQEQASHHKGNRYSVMVEVRMPPNHDLAARKAKLIRDMPTQLLSGTLRCSQPNQTRSIRLGSTASWFGCSPTTPW